MGFQMGIDCDQTMLFPVNPEDMIPKEHPVRIIDLFIHMLDLTKLQFLSSVPALEGRPGDDPKDLLKLHL